MSRAHTRAHLPALVLAVLLCLLFALLPNLQTAPAVPLETSSAARPVRSAPRSPRRAPEPAATRPRKRRPSTPRGPANHG